MQENHNHTHYGTGSMHYQTIDQSRDLMNTSYITEGGSRYDNNKTRNSCQNQTIQAIYGNKNNLKALNKNQIREIQINNSRTSKNFNKFTKNYG